MIKIAIIFFFMTTFMLFAQVGVTFTVEELTKPDNLLNNTNSKDVLKNLVFPDENNSIIAKSSLPDSLVYYGYNSFFNGMYQAYADHRPFVISPDMIWVLISQGFGMHVKQNSEELRYLFVNHSGKKSLVVSTALSHNDPKTDWEKIITSFTEEISKNTSNKLVELLTANFSTTTLSEKIASQVTIMQIMDPYFEYICFGAICGIPEITLKGTVEDWRKVLDKTKQLTQYKLNWWTDELIPILEEFISTSQGDIDKDFWMNMFKRHTHKRYGAPTSIDGWIIKFFPYDKFGKRLELNKIDGSDDLPDEIVKVDVKYIEINDDGTSKKTTLELWAGFIGLEQNNENYTLTPKIGWLVKKKINDEQSILESEIKRSGSISLRVNEVPSAVLKQKKIEVLELHFIDEINIPDSLSNVIIGQIKLYGKIDNDGIERINKLFPHTKVEIYPENSLFFKKMIISIYDFFYDLFY